MAKVKFKGLDTMSKNLQKRFTSFVNDPVEMKKASKTMRNELLSNLRGGIGSNDKPLPNLAQRAKNRRGSLSRYNNTHSRYSQNFSNVTFTGQFLRALDIKFIHNGRFLFKYKGIHKGYILDEDGEEQDDVSNSLIFKGLSERGWKLAGVTKKANQRIKRQFIRFIRRK